MPNQKFIKPGLLTCAARVLLPFDASLWPSKMPATVFLTGTEFTKTSTQEDISIWDKGEIATLR